MKEGDISFFETPQITADSIIKDSVNWIIIGGTFKATSAATYLTIGNFCTHDEYLTDFIGANASNKYDGSYYFIDDVSVKKISVTKPLITGNRPVCPGDSLKLKAEGWDNMQWFPYNENYQENKPANETTIVTSPKIKNVIVYGEICDWPVQDTVTLTFLPIPKIELGNDTLICNGSTIILNPGVGLQNFLWQDGSTTPTFSATQEGLYKVKAANSDGCFNKDSIKIGFYLNPKVNLGEDLEQCYPNGTFDATSKQKEDRYLWQDNSIKPQFNYTKEGEYNVIVENPCGIKDYDTITVYKIDLFIPNLITPNQDNLNDKFNITGTLEDNGSLSIFNRSGTKVYENKNYKNNWPEKDLTEGVYYYIYSYPTCEDKKGWVQIIK